MQTLVLICWKILYTKHFENNLFVFGMGLIQWIYLGMGLQNLVQLLFKKRLNILTLFLNVLCKVKDFITSQAFPHFTFTWVQTGEAL
jgi:hypothetical protein